MQMVLRDENRELVGRTSVDLAARPTRVAIKDQDREVFLHWEGAVDDSGRLRRCISCGCNDLYREKAFPQFTALFIVLAFAGAVIGVAGSIFGELGVTITTPMLIAMVIVLFIQICILIFSKTRLVCYRCGTSCRGIPIARYHKSWDRAIADRFPRKRHAWTESPSGLAASIMARTPGKRREPGDDEKPRSHDRNDSDTDPEPGPATPDRRPPSPSYRQRTPSRDRGIRT